ncbi:MULTISPECIES: ABC transporter permease [Gardnerella]|jgi:ABC superfamily ATP binding cassette transporter, membrane protein|uniref:ABC transporter permease n=1 Tax=Gardnerella TaxID=2701 RepID=UPI00030C22D7|nr:FtsX-like permease family protein [Gardnerella vaginalis]AYZ21132.1 FtsX-like permease family protein [Gardnerella vaginalis]NSX24456.1 ABC transporter permease [Gardnerella vaginalis]OKY56098.1 ABC transporter permease YtrF precursor [Gardnerella vaginalis]PNL25262.1 ABC transporter permease [Gardnerella vaginalis]PTE03662.1 ABC transporter permease [Gardnerella vaginalis]
MFMIRMVARSLARQIKKRVLIAIVVCLSACVSVAMLSVVYDVGDKINAELSSYGSNIIVQPKSNAVVNDLYASRTKSNYSNSQTSRTSQTLADAESQESTAFLKESDAAKIKMIFWAFNITNFAPKLTIYANLKANSSAESAKSANSVVPIVGTWFNRKLALASGETTVVGVRGMRSWWKMLEGRFPRDFKHEAAVGTNLAKSHNLKVGQRIKLTRSGRQISLKIVGIYDSGDSDNNAIYADSSQAQRLSNKPNMVEAIEVKALTTPENDLARKAAKNPAALSQEEWETWYCTAYPSSITYQIEEVIPGAVAKQVRQVSAMQGSVLNKTRAVMVLMTALSLVAAAVAVANLMAAAISERSGELALLKALGARDGAVARLMLMETAVIACAGALIGMIAGFGVAQVIGFSVFGSAISLRPMVFVLVFVLLAITVLAAAGSSIRSILHVRPAEVLHGR